jgi:hypothetical protein
MSRTPIAIPADALDALLCACLRPALSQETRVTLAALPEADARALAERAARHGVGPVLHHRFREEQVENLPAQLRDGLRQQYWITAAQNTALLHALEQVLRTLEGAGIPAIVLKGAALAEALYGNIALRPMGDADLLLHRADVERALVALAGLGYAPSHPQERPGAHLAYENEILLQRQPMGDALLELHWALFDAPFYQRLPADWFWATSVARMIADAPARVLGAEAMLLHLCGHAILHHRGERLLWLYDVALLLRQSPALDWGQVQEQARAQHVVLPLQAVLSWLVAQRWVDLPPGQAEQIESLRASAQERRLYRTMTDPGGAPAARVASDVRGLSGWRERLAFVATQFFPSPAYMRRRYGVRHAALLPLAYLGRLLRGVRGLWRRG